MPLLPEFLIRIICKKLTYYEWTKAHDKWFSALEKVNKKESFGSRIGFSDLTIIEQCSYCKKVNSCLRCSLFYRNACCINTTMPRLIRWLIGKAAFWKFVDKMNEIKLSWNDIANDDWTKALNYAQKVLMAINEDRPPQ